MVIADDTAAGRRSGEADASESIDRFDPPGPGSWMLDTTHHGRRPLTGFMSELSAENAVEGFARMAVKYGLPLETMQFADVNGYVYAKPKAVGEPEGAKSSKPPPRSVLWLLSRLHPELRRRNKTAKRVFTEEVWRRDLDEWFDRGGRETLVGINETFQAVDVAAIADDELAAHIEALATHIGQQLILGFETHGGDIVPTGDFLAHCADWGVQAAEASSLLAGSSPLTTETRDILAPVVSAVASADRDALTTVEAVRSLSPAADKAIDRWLRLHGRRALNSDDVDCPTLCELPVLQLQILMNPSELFSEPQVDIESIRNRVPPVDRSTFDRLLADARAGMRLRDDNVGIRLNWPVGLARRALIEAGHRLVIRQAIDDVEDVLNATASEVAGLLTGGSEPGREELGSRSQLRERRIAADAPLHLGPEEEPPPFDVFPPALRRVTQAVFAVVEAMQSESAGTPLSGTGVSGHAYTGRACVLPGADADFDLVQPGDVLIAPFTSPSFNSVFPLLGAVAVQEGGVMSHTAIVSREFGISSVVGVSGLLDEIEHGDIVEVDPVAGTVRRIEK